MKISSILVVLAVLCCAACSSSPRSASINHLVDADLAQMADADYRKAVKSIAAATKLEYPVLADMDANREAGPWQVLALGDGALVVSSLKGALLLTAVDAKGQQDWHKAVPLGKYSVGKPASINNHDSLGPVLSIPVDMGAVQRLVFAVDGNRCALIRAERANGTFAGHEFATALPIYKYARVKLESSTGSDSLEALMRLSSPDAKTERSVDAVRSQLEAFATSTNKWLAEAAAAVLILPTR